jgi:transposase
LDRHFHHAIHPNNWSEFPRPPLQVCLRQIKAHIDQVDAAVHYQIEACPKRRHVRMLIESIPGIGAVFANTILIEMPEPGRLYKKAVASLAGLASTTRRPGTGAARLS